MRCVLLICVVVPLVTPMRPGERSLREAPRSEQVELGLDRDQPDASFNGAGRRRYLIETGSDRCSC